MSLKSSFRDSSGGSGVVCDAATTDVTVDFLSSVGVGDVSCDGLPDQDESLV